MILLAEIEQFREEVAQHLFGAYLPFWCGPALDTQKGGWMAWLSNDLQPDRTQPRGLIVNTRILWAFSAAYRARPEPVYAEMAARAFDVIMHPFWDAQHGGAFWRVDDSWNVLEDDKKTYGQAFYIYALAEFHQAFGNADALARALALSALLERHAHDDTHGGYIEVSRRDWSPAGPEARLSAKDLPEKKSMNNQLHVLEAWTNLHRVCPDPQVSRRLRELIDLFLDRILDARTLHLHHFFDEAWQVRSNTYTFGHDIEASWLLCEAAEALGDGALRGRVEAMALRMAEVVLQQAMTPDGGIVYEGRAGTILDAGRECWPQAEALVGFLNAFQLSRQERFLTAARRVWQFIQAHLVDREHGEWFWRIQPDGAPDPTLPKVSEWKGPYHATRACLESLRRLTQISETISLRVP